MRGKRSNLAMPDEGIEMMSEFHSKELLEGLQNLRNMNVGVDIYLCSSSGNKLPAHKTVLSAVSPYFRNMWQTGQLMGTELSLPHIDNDVLLLLLNFVYTGKLSLRSELVWNVLTAASQLELRDAPELCRKFIDTYLSLNSASDHIHEKTQSGKNSDSVEASDTLFTDLVSTVKEEPVVSGDDDDWNVDPADEVDDDNYEPPTKRTFRKRGRPRKSEASKQPVARKRGRPRKTESPQKKDKPKRKPVATSRKVTTKEAKDVVPVKTYQCDLCQKLFNHKSGLSLHHKEHSKVLVNSLLLRSFFQFRLRKKYQNLTLEAGKGEIRCDKCQRVFHLYSKWIQHYKSKHLSSIKCNKCDRTFFSSLTLRQHCVRKHKQKLWTSKAGLRRFRIHCHRFKLGGKSRPRKSNRTDNMKRYFPHYDIKTHSLSFDPFENPLPEMMPKLEETGEENPFTCQHCGKVTKDKRSLYRHVYNMHGKGRQQQFPCSVCDKTFQYKAVWRRHLAEVHKLNTVQILCPYTHCGYTCTRKDAMKLHIQNEHEGISYTCDVPDCGRTYKSKMNLNAHKKESHGNVLFNCSKCSKEFTTPSRLKEHMRGVHSEPKDAKFALIYPCRYCERRFKYRSGRVAHEKSQHKNQRNEDTKSVTIVTDEITMPSF